MFVCTREVQVKEMRFQEETKEERESKNGVIYFLEI